ncbi:hypothetical protein Trydic_g23588 [Trypoxylus dichotomus]
MYFKTTFLFLYFVHESSANLRNVNVYARHFIEERNYTTLKNVNVNSLKRFRSLILFKCVVNVLQENDIDDLPVLNQLSISGVNLEELRPKCFGRLPNLQELYLAGNYVKRIPEGVFTNLQLTTLSLQENRIQGIDAHAFDIGTLQTLDLSNNKIKDINPDWFVKCMNLTDLNLSLNKLREIPNSAFKNARGLGTINLSQNQLKIIYDHSFFGLENLRLLNLGRNKIKTIENGALNQLKSLNILQLTDNHLVCLSDGVLDSFGDGVCVHLEMNKINEICVKKIKDFKLKHPGINIYY